MKKHLLFYLFISVIISETSIISGVVVDQNRNPIKDVNVYSESIGIATDKDGRFLLEITTPQLITFSHIGFDEIQIMSSEINDNIENNQIKMSSGIINSNKIIVSSGLKLEKLNNNAASTTIYNRNTLQKQMGSHFDYLIKQISNRIYSFF